MSENYFLRKGDTNERIYLTELYLLKFPCNSCSIILVQLFGRERVRDPGVAELCKRLVDELDLETLRYTAHHFLL